MQHFTGNAFPVLQVSPARFTRNAYPLVTPIPPPLPVCSTEVYPRFCVCGRWHKRTTTFHSRVRKVTVPSNGRHADGDVRGRGPFQLLARAGPGLQQHARCVEPPVGQSHVQRCGALGISLFQVYRRRVVVLVGDNATALCSSMVVVLIFLVRLLCSCMY